MNVFISQPMNGVSTEEILETRQRLFKEYKASHPTAKLIDSLISDKTMAYAKSSKAIRKPRVWCLAEALHYLAEADVLILAKGWEGAPGCRIERKVATYYDIPIEYA